MFDLRLDRPTNHSDLDVTEILSHLPRRLRAHGLASIPTVIHAQTLNGLYLQNQSIGRGDAWNYYYFWPDGHVCETMPKGGFGPSTTYAEVSRQAPANIREVANDRPINGEYAERAA